VLIELRFSFRTDGFLKAVKRSCMRVMYRRACDQIIYAKELQRKIKLMPKLRDIP